MKKIIAFLILLVLWMVYWKYSHNQDKERMIELATPFYNACQEKSGCIIAPDDWNKEKDNLYYKGRFTYKATFREFELEWHVTTDTFILATAGKDKKIAIKSRFE